MELRALVLPYPNFVLGAIIDPEEANENNYEISERVNDVYEYLLDFSTSNVKMTDSIDEISGDDLQDFLVEFKDFVDVNITTLQNQITSNDADITALQLKDVNLQTQITSNKNSITVLQNKDTNLQSQITSSASAISALQTLSNNLQSQITTNKLNIEGKLNTHKSSNDHDNRYYTKDDLTPFLRGGDTIIKEEVYTIINPDNGDGTFTYSNNGDVYSGELTPEGYQVFILREGNYVLGQNRVEITVNDTLRRSVRSGGIEEIDEHSVALTAIEGSGAEITIKYYERIGMTAEYNIKLSTEKPPYNNGQNMWFKIIG